LVLFPSGRAEDQTESNAANAPVEQSQSAESPRHTTKHLRGQVVWLDEALKRRFDIAVDPDAEHQTVALEVAEGPIIPIAKDARGRGFHKDERLRNVEMELVVRRFENSPVAQVIQVFTIKPDNTGTISKFELDYWCDICAISMFELKECECCQGPTRLRERLVGAVDATTSNESPGSSLR
jgi:hypothetical protein